MSRDGALLMLEDGRAFRGVAIGAATEALGEVVFQTSMTGYQEIATDPSYCGQIVVFTAPQVGNTGICEGDAQGDRPAACGLVLRALAPRASSWRSSATLEEWMIVQGLAGLAEVDTRALTRQLRQRGVMRGGIFPVPPEEGEARRRVQEIPQLAGQDLTARVTTARPYRLEPPGVVRCRAAVLDYGVKRGILAGLLQRGFQLDVLPAGATAAEVLAGSPDGVVLTNGPGDPAAVEAGIRTARELLGRRPLLGICLGHQLLGLALGGRTYKLPFGHHGGNHPVADLSGEGVWITAHNHGFAVEEASLPAGEVTVTHRSLYDGTLEGFAAPGLGALAVQFHPEGCPGPTDAVAVFDRFAALIEGGGRRA